MARLARLARLARQAGPRAPWPAGRSAAHPPSWFLLRKKQGRSPGDMMIVLTMR